MVVFILLIMVTSQIADWQIHDAAYTAFRNTALEFLDNLLDTEERRVLLPLLEERVPGALLDRARRTFDLPVGGREQALEKLLEQEDPWLRACSLYEVGHAGPGKLSDLCRRLTRDPEPLVRETAEWALNRSK